MKAVIVISAVLLAAGMLAPCLHAQSAARIEAERLFVEAQKALARGNDEQAESILMKALQSDETFASAIWQLSQIYEKRGQLEYARELLLRGLQQEPDAAWARDKLARMEKTLIKKLLAEAEGYMSRGLYDQAIPKLSLYLGIRPYDPVPLLQIARCHLAMGNLESAKEYLMQAAERDPSSTEIASLLDEVDRRTAKARIDTAVERARSMLADYSKETKGQVEKALSDVLALDPENEWAREKLREIALLEEEEQRPAPAEEAVSKGVEAIKTLERPTSRIMSIIRSNVTIIALAVIAVLLGLNIRRKASVRSYPLQGSISLIPILDIVSLLNSNLKSGALQITSPSGRGEVFFEKGEIVHARLKSWDGKKAFHKIMALQSGRYVYNNHLPKIRHTINEPLSLLLLSMKSVEEEKSRKQRRPSVPEKEEIFT